MRMLDYLLSSRCPCETCIHAVVRVRTVGTYGTRHQHRKPTPALPVLSALTSTGASEHNSFAANRSSHAHLSASLGAHLPPSPRPHQPGLPGISPQCPLKVRVPRDTRSSPHRQRSSSASSGLRFILPGQTVRSESKDRQLVSSSAVLRCRSSVCPPRATKCNM